MKTDLTLALKKLTEDQKKFEINSLEWCQLNSQIGETHYQLFCQLEYDEPYQAIQHLWRAREVCAHLAALKRLDNHAYSSFTQDINIGDITTDEMFFKGLMAYAGVGEPVNIKVALEYFEKAAEKGHANAQFSLGEMYAFGRGVDANILTAVKWYKLAADQGHAIAQFSLGHIYGKGMGVIVDVAVSEKWYQASANQGYRQAQRELALILSDKYSYFTDDDTKQTILKWYLAAAEQGSASAQYDLGLIYYHGMLGVGKDPQKSFLWFEKSAKHGDEAAQIYIASVYEKGNVDMGVTIDNQKAIEYYLSAAKKRNTTAQMKLFKYYFDGNFVPKDNNKAMRYLRYAAERKNKSAIEILEKYATGVKTTDSATTADFLYHFLALKRDVKNTNMLIIVNPNRFYELTINDTFLDSGTRHDFLKRLIDHEGISLTLDPVKLIDASIAVALYRYAHFSTLNSTMRIKITKNEIRYIEKLLSLVPQNHERYAESQAILGYLAYYQNELNEPAWLKHLANAHNADPNGTHGPILTALELAKALKTPISQSKVTLYTKQPDDSKLVNPGNESPTNSGPGNKDQNS